MFGTKPISDKFNQIFEVFSLTLADTLADITFKFQFGAPRHSFVTRAEQSCILLPENPHWAKLTLKIIQNLIAL